MKSFPTVRRRVLSAVLSVVMALSLLPMLPIDAGAVKHTNYATPSSQESRDKSAATFIGTPGGGFVRVVDGKVYVWGSNTSNSLGIGKVVSGSTTSTTLNTPTQLPLGADTGAIIQLGVDDSGAVYALSDNNQVWVWGGLSHNSGYVAGKYTSTNATYPTQLNTSNLPTGAKILEMNANSPTEVALKVQLADNSIQWWEHGSTSYGQDVLGISNADTRATNIYPVSEDFIDRLQPSYTSNACAIKFVKDTANRDDYRPIKSNETGSYGVGTTVYTLSGTTYTATTVTADNLDSTKAASWKYYSNKYIQGQDDYRPYNSTTDTSVTQLYYWNTISNSYELIDSTKTVNYYRVQKASERQGQSGRAKIANLLPLHHCASHFVLMDNGKLYTRGGNDCGHLLWPNSDSAGLIGGSPYELDSQIPAQSALSAAHPNWSTVKNNGNTGAVIDAEGNAWVWGGSSGSTLYADSSKFRIARKAFDASLYGVKVVEVYISSQVVVFLTEDNALYAIGKNTNQFIDATKDASTKITEPVEVFSSVARQSTIVGVYVTNSGVMVVTQEGDLSYAGDVESGALGDGQDHSNSDVTPGQAIESTPAGLPPVEPTSANEIIFEIESGTTLYRNIKDEDSGEATLMSKTKGAGSWSVADPPALDAGSTFKLNVYFNDFAKITSWVVPIRFNPYYVKVVNGNGVAYSDSEVVHPGALGASVGIVQEFNTTQWDGQIMGDGAKLTPSICNANGWVSVAGYSTNPKAKVSGEVKMFSILFKPQHNSNPGALTFTNATSDAQQYITYVSSNSTDNGNANLPTYDNALGNADYKYGAGWLISATGTSAAGSFKFDYGFDSEADAFPKATAQYVPLFDMGLTLTRSDGTEPARDSVSVTDYSGGDKLEGYGISSTATDTIYVVNANLTAPSGTQYAGKTPSDKKVNFSFEVVYPEAPGETTYDASDYVTIYATTDNTISFKLADGYDGGTALLKVTAVTEGYKQGSSTPITKALDVLIKSYSPPTSLDILQNVGTTANPNWLSVKDSTVIYDTTYAGLSTADLKQIFYVDYPENRPEGSETFQNMGVTWKLLDKDGYEIVSPAASDAVKLGSVTEPGKGGLEYVGNAPSTSYMGSVTLTPQHTTFDGDWVTLQVVSTVDSSVKAEVKILVHLKATDLEFNKGETTGVKYYKSDGALDSNGTIKILRMATETSYDLNSLVAMAPSGDVYQYNLQWTWEPTSPDSSTYIDWKGTSQIFAGSAGTALNESTGAYYYDKVTVTDTVSNLSDTIYVQVMELSSDLKPDDVKVSNVTGDANDTVTVSGLKAGDKVRFYYTYDSTTIYNEYGPLTATQLGIAGSNEANATGSFTFTTPKKGTSTFLYSEGGDIGVQLWRETETFTGDDAWQDKIPVAYDHEPSKVCGYIALAGKNQTSRRLEGIEVRLTGGLSKINPVYTQAGGYFEFEEYIIPGNYDMFISLNRYLDRQIQADSATGYRGITIPTPKEGQDEYFLSTIDDPIYLYPGDLDGNGEIRADDIGTYVREWVGENSASRANLSDYVFYDGDSTSSIGLFDLDMVTRHMGYTRNSYPKWYVPAQ